MRKRRIFAFPSGEGGPPLAVVDEESTVFAFYNPSTTTWSPSLCTREAWRNNVSVGRGRHLDAPFKTITANLTSIAKTNTNIGRGGVSPPAIPFKTITANPTAITKTNTDIGRGGACSSRHKRPPQTSSLSPKRTSIFVGVSPPAIPFKTITANLTAITETNTNIGRGGVSPPVTNAYRKQTAGVNPRPTTKIERSPL